ncbi:MAG: hypothetical protein CMG75_02370 [Candidatus Marinimicrobia bacterium]|nr:hypothetical protein [Candidatus Neomarinimicrobiota bacterium]|tara:strand:+ start:2461 stop:11580 length:9120 start_codon:yes stop_codon:yes gene_type:complete
MIIAPKIRTIALGVLIVFPLYTSAQFKYEKRDIDTDDVYDLIVEDIDGNSTIDIVTANNNMIQWYKNDGAGNFTIFTVSNSVQGVRSVHNADINSDGRMDILSASQNDDKIAWHENMGGDPVTWTTRTISTSADGANSVYALDMDGDGDLDVFSSSPNDGKVSWYENTTGNGSVWTNHTVISGTSADKNITAAKITNDNLVDIISTGVDFIVFEKGSSGPEDFTTHIIGTQGQDYFSKQLFGIDFDLDGDIDFLSGYNYRRISIWENNGFPGTAFTRYDIQNFNPDNQGFYPQAVYPVDIDKDNDMDIITASYHTSGTVVQLIHKGGYNFDAVTIYDTKKNSPYFQAIMAADFDGDNDIDIVLGSRRFSPELFWLESSPNNTAVTVEFVTSVQGDGTYGQGDILPIEVHFSSYPLDVTGTPALTLNIGGTNKTINRHSLKDSIMTFHYTVEAGHNAAALDIASTTSLTGNIKNFNLDADLALPIPGDPNSLAGRKTLIVDTEAPVVNSVSSTKADGIYGPGEVIPITVEFDDIVTAMGPLTLDANWTTNSSHIGGTNQWQSFTAENNGKIRKIEIELQSPLGNNQSNSRAASATLKIYQGEGNAGSEIHSQPITLLNKDNSWKTFHLSTPVTITAGQQYTWEIHTPVSERSWLRYFNSNAYSGGRSSSSPNREYLFRIYVEETGPDLKLTLETGTNDAVVDYTSGTGTNTFTFNYTVAADHESADLDYEQTSSLVLISGIVKDAGENSVVSPIDLPSPGTANSLGGNKNIQLDTEPPTITFDPTDSSTEVLQGKSVTLTFSDNVRKLDDGPLDNANVDAMIELKKNDANGVDAATGIDATWDAANNRITIAHDDFASEEVVYAALKANTIEDLFNNPIPAENITFTVEDAMAPIVVFSPSDGATAVTLSTSLKITFSEPVRNIDDSALDDTNVDARIILKKDDTNGADLSFDATINASKDTIIVNPDIDFEGEQDIYACIDNQVEDSSNNAIAETCITFSTEDVAPPSVTILPGDGAIAVKKDVVITVNFSEPVRNIDDTELDDTNVDALITLKKDDANGNDIISDASIKISRKKITLVPQNDFGSEEKVYFCIDPVEDSSNNATVRECVTFTTADISAASITIDPSDGTTDVAVDKIITITSSEPLRNLDDSALDNNNIDRYILLKENSSSGTDISFDATIDAGLALDFDGVDDYVDINNIADDMAGLTNWAVSFWAKPTKASFPENDGYLLANNCDNGSTNCNKILFGISKATGIVTVYEEPGGVTIAGSATNDGNWNHIVYSRTGTTGVLYLNGSADGTHTPAHADFVASDKWSLGHEWDGTTVTNEFVGSMDEVAVWNDALATNEVTALYNSGVALDATTNSGDYTSSANLVGYWRMQDGSGTTVTDLSGNSNDGTIAGNPSWTTTSSIVSVNPTSNLLSEQTVYVDICCVEDEDGNLIATTSSTFTTADVDPPTVSFDPADGETDVLVDKEITLTFSEPIRNIDNSDITNNNVEALIALKDTDANGSNINLSSVEINNAKTVITIQAAADFSSEQKVYVAILDKVVEDDANNAIDLTSAIFTIEDKEPPSITFFPVDGATGVPINTIPSMTFSEPILSTNGQTLQNADLAALITFKETDASGTNIGIGTIEINAAKNVITITAAANFPSEQDVYMCIDPIEDSFGNESIQECATFRTSDVILPVVTWNPPNGSIEVAVSKTISLEFDEPVRLVNNGQLTNDNVDALITLNYDDANGEEIAFDATINASSDVISVDPTNPLGSEKTIYVAIGTTVEDDQNNAILASSSTFITTDSEPPVVAFSPSDGSTEISIDSEIVLTFSEPVRLIDGTEIDSSNIISLVTLEKFQSNNSKPNFGGQEVTIPIPKGLSKSVWNELFSASMVSLGLVEFDAKVNDDKTVVTLTPKVDLESERIYKVSIGATVEDSGDNPLAPSSASFTTADEEPPIVTFNPADGDTGISVSTDITITFDEAIRYLDDSEVTSANANTIIVLKKNDSLGVDISFTPLVNIHKTEIKLTLGSILPVAQKVYVGIGPQVEDDVDNPIVASSAIFTTEESPEIKILGPAISYTTEEGGTTSFSLVLGKEPTDDVVLGIKSQDETEGITSVSGLTFKRQLWDQPLDVEITGQNDEIDDGDVSYLIGLLGVVSNDSRYNGIDPDDILLTNIDDSDEAGITVLPRRGLETTEKAAKDSFSIQLESEPVSTVKISFEIAKPKEGSISTDSLIFNGTNWNMPQTVIVTGLNDSIVDGDRTYKIITKKPVSEDSIYAQINPKDVIVTNRAREPILMVKTDSLDYGRVPRDAFNVQSFEIVNIGTDTLHVSEGSINSTAFIPNETEFVVAPKDTFTIFIQFIPDDAGIYNEQFTAKHDDTSIGDLIVELMGEAFKPTIATTDTVIDFGRVFVFFDEQRRIPIFNSGNSDLRIDSLFVTGKQFSIPPIESFYIEPSDTVIIPLIFSSQDTGKAKGNMRIFSNDQDNPRLDLPILATILPPDTLGPEISNINITPGDVLLRQFITISSDIGDANRVDDAVLYFVKGGDSEFESYSLETDDSLTYNFVSGAAEVTLKGVAFYVIATDERGNISVSDTISPSVNFKGGSLNTAINESVYSNGIPKKLWRLISVPAGLDDPDIVNTFGDELKGKPNTRKWRMFERDVTSGGSDWIKPDAIEAGAGYWIIQAVEKQPQLSTGSGKTIPLTGFDITLQPGWNMIGSPYAFPVKTTFDANSVYGPLSYGFDGEGWSESDSLKPWAGYIVYNRKNEAVDINIDPLAKTPEVLQNRTLARSIKSDEWRLRLSAKGKKYMDVENFIGRTTLAEETLDKYDVPEPPYVENYISLVLETEDLFGKSQHMTSDIRSSFNRNGIWDVLLNVKGEKHPIEFSYDLTGSFPKEDHMLLLDMNTRKQYNLLDYEEFQISDYTEKFPYKFKVFSGSPEFVALAIEDALSLLPDDFSLRQNYPNPFNPSTTIEFTLPKPTDVSLVVYNLMGQQVRTLKRGMMDTGHHSMIWHGKDDHGKLLSSGVYLVRLQSKAFVSSRKMLMLK